MLRKYLLNILCLFIFFLHGHVRIPLAYAEDKIVAIVNNSAITQKELNDFITFMRLQLEGEKKYSGEELENKLASIKDDLLEKLIEDKLILQEAKKNNVKVEESLVKARMLQIKKRYNSEEEFRRSLIIQGLTEADVEQRIWEQAAMYNIIERKVKSRISVSPSEVTDFYTVNIEEFKFPERRNLKYIKTVDLDVAREVQARLKEGEGLSSAAEKSSLKTNSLSVTGKEELRLQLKRIVFGLKKGEISQVVQVDDQYYIFELREITPSRTQSLSEAQDSIHKFLFEKKLQERLTSWLDELKKNSYINITGN